MPESRPTKLPSMLATILADRTARLEEQKHAVSLTELEKLCRDLVPPLDFRLAVDPASRAESREGFAASIAIIAEFKRRSPSRGVIRPNFDLAGIHAAYQAGGADAYSVLTEEDHFGGSLDDLRALRERAEIPVLRKDFLFDPYQIYESRAAGADALLLIVAALDDRRLIELLDLCRSLDMEALVEVHTSEELQRALACGARIVGINNRDLHTFEIDFDVSLRLARNIPGNITVVSESGIRGSDDIRRLRAVGIQAFLVGEHLLRSEDPAALLRRFKEAL